MRQTAHAAVSPAELRVLLKSGFHPHHRKRVVENRETDAPRRIPRASSRDSRCRSLEFRLVCVLPFGDEPGAGPFKGSTTGDSGLAARTHHAARAPTPQVLTAVPAPHPGHLRTYHAGRPEAGRICPLIYTGPSENSVGRPHLVTLSGQCACASCTHSWGQGIK